MGRPAVSGTVQPLWKQWIDWFKPFEICRNALGIAVPASSSIVGR